MAKTVCIYHSDCADGFGAAWVVNKALNNPNVRLPDDGGVVFHAAEYDSEPPWHLFKKSSNVFIVDFSYPEEVLLKIGEASNFVYVIDHHESAERRLAKFAGPIGNRSEGRNIQAWFDMERSGCTMAWDFFFPSKKAPGLLLSIQDRDLWRWEYWDTAEITAALFSYPYDFGVWDDLMYHRYDGLRAEGEAILRKQEKDIAELLKSVTSEMYIGGLKVPAANMSRTYRSEAGNILCRGKPFAAVYWFTSDYVEFALRSDANTSLHANVSQIAETYGGGGHRNAAGFKVDHIKFFEMLSGREVLRDTKTLDLSYRGEDGLFGASSALASVDFAKVEGKVAVLWDEASMACCDNCVSRHKEAWETPCNGCGSKEKGPYVNFTLDKAVFESKFDAKNTCATCWFVAQEGDAEPCCSCTNFGKGSPQNA